MIPFFDPGKMLTLWVDVCLGEWMRKGQMLKRLCLFLLGSYIPVLVPLTLSLQQNFNGRNEKFQICYNSNYKVGQNLMVNRFKPLNNKIEYTWFNESFNSFKIKCKKLLLQ